jgi:hypothetical protein
MDLYMLRKTTITAMEYFNKMMIIFTQVEMIKESIQLIKSYTEEKSIPGLPYEEIEVLKNKIEEQQHIIKTMEDMYNSTIANMK